MGIRIKIVQSLIHLNERFRFYPKLRSFYEKNLLVSNPVILDVGMNKGQSIEFFRSVAKTAVIHGFEPNPSLFKILNIKYGKDSDIKLNNLGVSKEKGTLTFYENVMDETSSFEPLNFDSPYLETKAKVLGVEPSKIIKDQYPVAVVRLADYIEEQELKKIDLIKIDTEGHEMACLEGLFAKPVACYIEFIQLEQHNDDMYKKRVQSTAIEELLELNGYKEACRIKHGFGDFYEIVYRNTN